MGFGMAGPPLGLELLDGGSAVLGEPLQELFGRVGLDSGLRSHEQGVGVDAGGATAGAQQFTPQLRVRAGEGGAAVEVVVLAHSLVGDRKSTRLNSSHVAISYSVYWL